MVSPNMSNPKCLYKKNFEFHYNWEQVTAAWLRKFPDPRLKQVKSVETASCDLALARVCNDSLKLRRVFLVSFGVPHWIQRIVAIPTSGICVEEACWDLSRRHLVTYGRNETLKDLFCMELVCTYAEVAPGRTMYTQEATVIHRQGILSGPFLNLAVKFLMKTSNSTVQKGVDVMVAKVEALVLEDQERMTDGIHGM
eukprot:gnl/MRDRNA2_/MRDRNA2_33002_c0_seq1.p1 gnl/MRDRNA2_/MRDRNA2_33002_c0~~gnl/MRDRNA2_/MRDRNA2_33002_c0_seq1.p1  ORF type:complete len:197 (+),score=37.93 gnl/MRDRNA2_/MRDRNA2_33002_c0_seq1:75-665(+)